MSLVFAFYGYAYPFNSGLHSGPVLTGKRMPAASTAKIRDDETYDLAGMVRSHESTG